ncbi:MAG: 16S rRNA (cytosine(967)-C(5))-methyltransferase RsmB [Nitrospira sp.]|nr:16S rRNA (cytosine(967)-C(5))-methyltransferase RsmB [Nitrospira sp.]
MPGTSKSLNSAKYSPRSVVLSILLASQRHDRALEEVMDQRVKSVSDPRDRSLIMELVYGVLRRQETLDWRLSAVLTKPLHRLPALVQMLLRIGAYQLLFLDRIPASAAVHETVELAKASTQQLSRDWSALVNAVLRNLIRLPVPNLPDPAIHPTEYLSISYGIPLWLSQRWLARLAYTEAELACQAASVVPSITLRVNRIRQTRESLLEQFAKAGITAHPTAISSVGVKLEKGQDVTLLPGFEAGDYYVEDEAAQLIPSILAPQPGESILDVCAAPGGKATHLAELMGDRGAIVALDLKPSRLELLRGNCRRLGLHCIVPIVGDARRPSDWPIDRTVSRHAGLPIFDSILVDAPCSGLGVLRRHPESKGQRQESALARHQLLQGQILGSVAPCLRPGGVLVYSTCSTETEETEEVINRFCKAYPGWIRESVAPWLPPAALPFVTEQGALSTMCNRVGMDGFYAVRLRNMS